MIGKSSLLSAFVVFHVFPFTLVGQMWSWNWELGAV